MLAFPTEPGSADKIVARGLMMCTKLMLMKQSFFNLLKHKMATNSNAIRWTTRADTFTMKRKMIGGGC